MMQNEPAVDEVKLEEGEEDEDESCVKVLVRIRPLLAFETKSGNTRDALTSDPGKGVIHLDSGNIGNRSSVKRKTFRFDGVLEEQQGQQDVFKVAGIDRMIDAVLDGYDATIFAYGQTGSGKTHTMEGYEYDEASFSRDVQANVKSTDPERLGIVPRSTQFLFNRLKKRADAGSVQFRVRCSFVQIYNEKILDLLNPGHLLLAQQDLTNKGVKVSRKKKKEKQQSVSDIQDMPGLRMRYNTADGQFYVENLFEVECENASDLMYQFEKGVGAKIMGSHRLNASSSRSHCLFTVYVDIMDTSQPNQPKFSSRLSLIDLAGSERVRLTGATGKTFKEATCINKSLFALRNVITAIALEQEQKTKHLSSALNQAHVPYRDSKLTSLLQHSLSGASHTLMIACISPCDSHAEENLSTLAYAARANTIKVRPKRGLPPHMKLIAKLRREIVLLKKQLVHAQQVSKITLQTNLKSEVASSSISKSGDTQLKKELLNSIAMMKKMHEIELELRERMETAENEAQTLVREVRLVNNENQRIRDHEQVLLHLLEEGENGQGDVAKELLKLKEENAQLKDTISTLRATSSAEQHEHEYAAKRTTSQTTTTRVRSRKKKARKPQVMSVNQLRTLLAGSNNNPADRGERQKRPSKSKMDMSRSSPRRALLLQKGEGKTYGGMITPPTSSREERQTINTSHFLPKVTEASLTSSQVGGSLATLSNLLFKKSLD